MTPALPLSPSAVETTGTKVHIIGAGGVGMSGLALLLKRSGCEITASDATDSVYLRKLAEKDITTWVGSDPGRIARDAHVYYSSAIKPEDPERAFAEQSGMRCESRHALLSAITAEYYTIAIAGCHGKTTTSAWIAELLVAGGFDPTALIGGTVPAWQSNYREGAGRIDSLPVLVIEADESDRSFLSIAARAALVTNIDLDHTDVHASLETLRDDFTAFAKSALAHGGWIAASKECDEAVTALMHEPDKALRNQISIHPDKHALELGGRFFPVGLAGEHNLMNASLVLQTGLKLAVAPDIIADVLQNFNGVNRRMQKLAVFPRNKLTVIDDYAHHPQEIAATLAALAPQYERLLVFWEPHRLSRFCHFSEEFETALKPYAHNSNVLVLPIFVSGDRASDYPQAENLYQKFRESPFRAIDAIPELRPELIRIDGKNTAAVFMGAGKSSDYAHEFVSWIRTQIGENENKLS